MQRDSFPCAELTYRIIGLAMQVHRRLGPGLLESIYEAQLLTYLRLAECPVGLLINFNTVSLSDGIKRRVL